MTHDEARLACSRKLDDDLDAGLTKQLETHLTSCADCREFSAKLSRSGDSGSAMASCGARA